MEKNFYDIYQKYMSMTKEELAALLTSKEMLEINDNLTYVKKFDFETFDGRCRTWSDCTNPCRDCVNCPLRYTTGDNWGINSNLSDTMEFENTSTSTNNYDYSILDRLKKMTGD